LGSSKKNRCIQKLRKLWASDLTFRQKVDVHNSTIISALTYVSSNIIKVVGKYDALLYKGEEVDKAFRKIVV